MSEVFVAQLYRSILGREPDKAGLAFWSQALESGEISATALTEQFIDSAEFATFVAPIARLYITALDRVPDAQGLQFWVKAYREGASFSQIVQAVTGSDEFRDKSEASSDLAFITQLYESALGRAPDAAGLLFWTQAMENGVSRALVVQNIAQSVEMTQAQAPMLDHALLHLALTGQALLITDIRDALPVASWPALIESIYKGPNYQGTDVPGIDRYVPPAPEPQPEPEPEPRPPLPPTPPLPAQSESDPGPAPDTTPPMILRFAVASATQLSVESSEPGSAALYTGGADTDLIASTATSLPSANLPYDIPIGPQLVLTNAALKVSDTAANTTTSPTRVFLGTDGDDDFTGTAGTDFLFGFRGDNNYLYSSMAALMAGGALVDWIQGSVSGDDLILLNITDAITITSADSFARAQSIETLSVGVANANDINISLGSDFVDAGVRVVMLAADTNPSGNNTLDLSATNTALGFRLTGSSGRDVLVGGAGDDTIRGGDGNDTLTGGVGADDIYAGSGADVIIFNSIKSSGSDSNNADKDILRDISSDDLVQLNLTNINLFSVDSNVSISGPYYVVDVDGNGWPYDANTGDIVAIVYGWEGLFTESFARGRTVVRLSGTNHADTLTGGVNNDTIIGGAGVDTMIGGDGDDVFVIESAADHRESEEIVGGNGIDVIRFSSTTPGDILYLTWWVDVEEVRIVAPDGTPNATANLGINANWLGEDVSIRLYGNSEDNQIVGNGDGNNTIEGGAGNDTITGGARADSMRGGEGNDVMTGGNGNDLLIGNEGDDLIDGNEGDDQVNAGQGHDTIRGGDGNDQLQGGSTGDDVIDGEDGNDVVEGGAGTDRLTGGAGADQFVYLAVSNSAASVAANSTVTFDSITDFTPGADDLNIAAINTVLTGGGAATGVTVTTLITDRSSINDFSIDDFAELKAAIEAVPGLLVASAAGAAGAATGIQAYLIDLNDNTGALGMGVYLLINNNNTTITADDVMINWTGTSQTPVGATDFILA